MLPPEPLLAMVEVLAVTYTADWALAATVSAVVDTLATLDTATVGPPLPAPLLAGPMPLAFVETVTVGDVPPTPPVVVDPSGPKTDTFPPQAAAHAKPIAKKATCLTSTPHSERNAFSRRTSMRGSFADRLRRRPQPASA
jgi:hypothetical protein